MGFDLMNQLRYTVLIEKNEDDGYTVTVTSLPGCISEGDTWDDAIANITEAIEGYLDVLDELHKPIPVEITVQTHKEITA
ncbi:type II toxin-antitoxin system HicB family antitoxin [Methanospirillum stamsii]|uniref:type II toxin-antitoxin system HicB family antitoxin n=1 Tax=Methanospirillum stamsii TaxID=1277351 RepID=UPI0015E84FAB|nr:type II toxin-antitoxin system HicB family antitoxin [Methanospirillum stamsii]